ncbi:hypothetical protein COLSTE_01952 [Collinsella stercoris DSM 13279]|uniref:Uncharacterized protein n=1 Tax=Collinsella stercoris DSM 13279 TaxID=445975 RepID=B6GCX5_9ACTN|nr:hypothetical protein COLSTE_01952 [Collinsella stercoris DSM 13279]
MRPSISSRRSAIRAAYLSSIRHSSTPAAITPPFEIQRRRAHARGPARRHTNATDAAPPSGHRIPRQSLYRAL